MMGYFINSIIIKNFISCNRVFLINLNNKENNNYD